MKARVGDMIQSNQEQEIVGDGAMEEEPIPPSQIDQVSMIEEMIHNPFEVKVEEGVENQEIRKGLFMESKTQNLISLQTLPPPLTVLFNSTVTQNIKAQAALTNRLILKIMFEKYNLVSIMSHFKKIFLGERGDYTEGLINALYGEGVTIGPGEIRARSLLNLDSLFNSWKYDKGEESDWNLLFKFKIKKNINWDDLQHISIISTNINDLVKASCKLPPPISFLMND